MGNNRLWIHVDTKKHPIIAIRCFYHPGGGKMGFHQCYRLLTSPICYLFLNIYRQGNIITFYKLFSLRKID